TYPAGSLVIKRDQPYGRLARTLLEKQTFPDPSLRTYDDTGWTRGLLLQVDVKATADASVLDAETTLIDTVPPADAPANLDGAVAWVVPHHGANAMVTLRHRLKDLAVHAATEAFTVGEREVPAGSFIVAA